MACKDCGVNGMGVPRKPLALAEEAAPVVAGVAEVESEELPEEFLLREWLSCWKR